LQADLANRLGNRDKQVEGLERALALGGNFLEHRIELIRIYLGEG
jgi:hypothetical protein